MELWQEAYRTVEDVHAILGLMTVKPKAKPMAAYHAQLAKIFWVARNTLFHGMSLARLYTLTNSLTGLKPAATEMALLASRAVLAALATPCASPIVDINLLKYDLEHEKTKRMAQMLAFPLELSRVSLIEEVERKGLLELAMPEIRELFELTEGTFFPLDLARRATPLLLAIREDPSLGQYDVALRRLVGLRMLQQMESVYLTVRIERVTSAISILTWSEITDLILWAAKHDLLSLRIDEKSGQIRQRAAQANAVLSSEVRDTLAKFATSLEAVSDRLRAAEVAKRQAEARASLYCTIEAGVKEEHAKILARRLVIERRKEEQERVALEREKERSRIKAVKAREELAEEKARLRAEAVKRDSDRASKEAKEEEAVAMRKLAEQMVEQRQHMKIAKKKGWGTVDGGAKKKVETNVDTLANKERSELMREQKELILDERAEFEKRLESMAKRHDHLERARRHEERVALSASWEDAQKGDTAAHVDHAKELEVQTKAGRAHDVAEKVRFSRMGEHVTVFSATRMASRAAAHVAVVAEWREEQARRKEEARAARAAELAEEKAREEAIENARREAEEEEARRVQEAAEAARMKAEAEEERKRVAERQKARERELEEKAKREQLDMQAARMNERSAAGVRSWGEDDDEALPEVRGKPDDNKPEALARRTPNDERWEDRRLGGAREAGSEPRGGLGRRDPPPQRGGDRWESARGGVNGCAASPPCHTSPPYQTRCPSGVPSLVSGRAMARRLAPPKHAALIGTEAAHAASHVIL